MNAPHPARDQRSQEPWEEVIINSTGQGGVDGGSESPRSRGQEEVEL